MAFQRAVPLPLPSLRLFETTPVCVVDKIVPALVCSLPLRRDVGRFRRNQPKGSGLRRNRALLARGIGTSWIELDLRACALLTRRAQTIPPFDFV